MTQTNVITVAICCFLCTLFGTLAGYLMASFIGFRAGELTFPAPKKKKHGLRDVVVMTEERDKAIMDAANIDKKEDLDLPPVPTT